MNRYPQFRYIESGVSSGCYNMALDESLYICYDPQMDLPVFRIYGWDRPTLSIGRFQDPGSFIDMEKLKMYNIPLVRRITGGGAILHHNELTYSVICGEDFLKGHDIKESYRFLTNFLIKTYKSLGFDPCYATEYTVNSHKPAEKTDYCFSSRETYDILINGRKIGGNAQRRSRSKVFQHGSIPFNSDKELLKEIFIDNTSISTADPIYLGMLLDPIDPESITSALKENFKKNMNTDLIDTVLTKIEEESLNRLLKDKYNDE